MDIKLQNAYCTDVPIAEVENYFLAEYRQGDKTVVFRLYDGSMLEWTVDDPELVLCKIDKLMDFYYSNTTHNLSQKYYDLEVM